MQANPRPWCSRVTTDRTEGLFSVLKPACIATFVILSLAGCGPSATPPPTAGSGTPTATTSGNPAIKDPTNFYAYYSDPSITKPPAKDALFGNGQVISIEYDGSKSKEGDSLFYQLHYVDPQGEVRPATGGSFTGVTRGTFTTDSKVYTSEANGRPGFMEVTCVNNAKVVGGDKGVTGTSVKLGMYPIKFEVAQ